MTMPLITYNTKADFDNAYRIGAEPEGRPNNRPEIKLHYNRAVLFPLHEKRAAKLVEIFNWPTDTNILIVGAGYAWTAEVLETDYGYTNIVTTDTSNWIQSNQDTTEEADIDAAIQAVGLDPATGDGLTKKNRILGRGRGPGNRRRHSRSIQNEALNNNGSRNRIRSVLGDIQVGITEEVITTLTDQEVTTISGWVDNINPNIDRIHLTTVRQVKGQDEGYNWKTLAEWKLLLPNDTFVSLNSWEVL